MNAAVLLLFVVFTMVHSFAPTSRKVYFSGMKLNAWDPCHTVNIFAPANADKKKASNAVDSAAADAPAKKKSPAKPRAKKVAVEKGDDAESEVKPVGSAAADAPAKKKSPAKPRTKKVAVVKNDDQTKIAEIDQPQEKKPAAPKKAAATKKVAAPKKAAVTKKAALLKTVAVSKAKA